MESFKQLQLMLNVLYLNLNAKMIEKHGFTFRSLVLPV